MFTIRKIEKRKDYKKFVRFPTKLYKSNPNYIPPMEADEYKMTTKRNAHYKECIQAYFLAEDENGKVIDSVEKVELEKSKYAGFELKGKNLGIIGLGAIGGLVANTAVELGMNVFGYDPYISITHAWGLSKNITRVTTLDDLYEKSDVID